MALAHKRAPPRKREPFTSTKSVEATTNRAHRSPLFLRRPISFSEDDACVMHSPHNDALIVMMQSGSCRVSRILVDSGSSVNILYESALDRMEDTPEMTRTMTCPQTHQICMGLTGMRYARPAQITLPIRADPYNVITEFYVIDGASLHNAILRRSWVHMMEVVPSSYHQLLRYPTSVGTTDIRGDQAMSPSFAAIAQKRSGWFQSKPPSGEETKNSRSMATSERRGLDDRILQ